MDKETNTLIESLGLKVQEIRGLIENARRKELVKNVERVRVVDPLPETYYERIFPKDYEGYY